MPTTLRDILLDYSRELTAEVLSKQLRGEVIGENPDDTIDNLDRIIEPILNNYLRKQ